MGRVLENNSKNLLKGMNIPIPEFRIASTPQEAELAAAELKKPVVVKALIPTGKRGKAGAVRFANSPEQAKEEAAKILGMVVSYYRVEKVLVEEKLEIVQELYLSVAMDCNKKRIVVIASPRGGVDIEEINSQHPESIVKHYVDPLLGLPNFRCKEICGDLGLTGNVLKSAIGVLKKVFDAFVKYDCTILEINPLAITTKGDLVAASSLMSIDDAALSRHGNILDMVVVGSERVWHPMTELEKRAVAVNEADPYRGTARYTEIDGGDIGFMCGGGGGSLMVFDTLLSYGGKPANYTEWGGNPPEEKIYGLTKVVLSKNGVKGLLVDANITNNTQVDVVAKGIIRVIRDMKIDTTKFPVVIRLAGVNDAMAKGIFEGNNIEYYGENATMAEAAKVIVERIKRG